MGRKRSVYEGEGVKKCWVSLYMPVALRDEIEEDAKAKDVSRNEYMVRVLSKYVLW